LLVTGGHDGKLIAWNPNTRAKQFIVRLASSWVMDCALTTSGQLLASGGIDNCVVVHDLASAAASRTVELLPETNTVLNAHQGCVTALRFTANDSLLSSSADGKVVLWDPMAAKKIRVRGLLSKNDPALYTLYFLRIVHLN